MITIQEAYNKAFMDLMSTGNNTVAHEKFTEGKYFGTLYIKKNATWRSRPSVVVYLKRIDGPRNKNGNLMLINKQEKLDFLNSKGISSGKYLLLSQNFLLYPTTGCAITLCPFSIFNFILVSLFMFL